MVLRSEAGALRGLLDRGGDRSFDCRRRGKILDATTARADEMVMVRSEIFGELEARELVVRDDPPDDVRLLEHDEIAVHGALREPPPVPQHFGDREWTVGAREDLDEALADRRHPLLVRVQTVAHDLVELLDLERVMRVVRRHRRRVYGLRSPRWT